MKKFLLTLILTLFFIPCVKADDGIEYVEVMQQDYIAVKNVTSSTGGCLDYNCTTNGAPTDSTLKKYYYYNDIETFLKSSKNKAIFDRLYEELDSNYELNYKTNYPYKRLRVVILSTSSSKFNLGVLGLDLVVSSVNDIYSQDDNPNSSFRNTIHFYNFYNLGNYLGISSLSTGQYSPNYCYGIRGNNPGQFCPVNLFSNFPLKVGTGDFATTWFYLPLNYYASNYDYTLKNVTTHFTAYDKDKKVVFQDLTAGDVVPPLKEFPKPVNYTEVNLDNYPYVILYPKNYNSTENVEVNMKVKGMVGITPVYEYGTIQKTLVTDRCNQSFNTLTDYKLYINKSDFTNKSIFYVKECEPGSILKFDADKMNIHYITDESEENLTLTIDGQEHRIWKFSELGRTANSNEEDNFVPGSSEGFNPPAAAETGLKGAISKIIGTVVDSFKVLGDLLSGVFGAITSMFGMFTTFNGFVANLFNMLPQEFRAIALCSFTIGCLICLFKFLK